MFQKNDDVKENEGQSVDQVESIEKVKEFLSLIPVNHLVQKKEPVDQINDEKKNLSEKKQLLKDYIEVYKIIFMKYFFDSKVNFKGFLEEKEGSLKMKFREHVSCITQIN